MRISVIGSGYVGLTTAICLAGNENKVVCIDTDKTKVDQINKGKLPFYEEGLESRLASYVNGKGCLKATSDYYAIENSDITFICVGTPCDSKGSIDLSCIRRSATEIGRMLNQGNNYQTVVVRSTVIPGTTEEVVLPTLEESSDMKAGRDFSVAVNPEFLQEGKALQDFAHPDKIIIGEYDHRAGDILEKLFHHFSAPIIRTNIRTAEMIKYASNAFLATKISFINEIGNICKKLDIDVYEVAEAIGHDPRIGRKFLDAGIGFGGSCLPKDVSALISKGNKLGYKAELLQSILNINLEQPSRLINIVRMRMGSLKDKVITVLGLAFKPNTDDTRQAPSLQIIDLLRAEGAKVKVYDPIVKPGIKLPGSDGIEFCSNVPDTIADSDCIILATEWDEFRDENLYAGKFVIDGRRVLDPEKARQVCQYYEGICW
jgi:UDPglucose 6-dehydrogenase